MHFKFTTSHFQRFGERAEAIACLANNLLEAEIATLPEVFLRKDTLGEWFDAQYVNYTKTHRARLWGVEEIKQKKCEPHEMHVTFVDGLPSHGRCNKCGKRLVAKWEES